MSYHIVSIDSPKCSLSCRDGQLTCQLADGATRRLPMEDIASIIISSFSANIHGQVFLEAARHGVSVVICEGHKPASLMLPANRATDTLLTKAVLALPPKTRQALWQKTVDAKCRNQFLLAQHLAPNDKSLPLLELTAAGKKPQKEAICAKIYWPIMGRVLDTWETSQGVPPDEKQRFSRKRQPRHTGGFNSLLNYGYAVLLSAILQKLFGVGLDPTFGLSHALRERSTPLAYDLMEPFRPCVDWQALLWLRQQEPGTPLEVSTAYKRWITQFTVEKVAYLDSTMEIQNVLEGVVRTFRRAVISGKVSDYKPWTPKNSKWAG